jgi:hypothetical protein
MKLNTWPARRGIDWVRLGMRTFFRQPLALGGLFFMFFAVLSVVGIVPLVGGIIQVAIAPALFVGLMKATELADAGQFPMPRVLFAGLIEKPTRVPLLQLGLVAVVIGMGLMYATPLIDGGSFLNITSGKEKLMLDDKDPSNLIRFTLMLTGCIGAVMLLLWHAPALIYWHGVPVVKALFFSLIALWRNVGAMLVYFVAWFAALMAISMVLGSVLVLFNAQSAAPLVSGPISLLLITAFFVSLFFTSRDTFAVALESKPDAATPAPGEQP